MTTLSEFTSLVKAEANQGTRLDTVIPGAIRRAARFIETNYSFLYMERFQQATLDVSAENPRFLPFPGESTKKINFVRYAQTFGSVSEYVYLKPIDPIDNTLIVNTSNPTAYWLTGDETGARFMVLNRTGTENLDLEIHSVEYSTWPESDTATHWLLNNAEDALLAKTMQRLARYAEEPDWLQVYKEPWEEAIRVTLMADEEARYSGPADGYKMVFR